MAEVFCCESQTQSQGCSEAAVLYSKQILYLIFRKEQVYCSLQERQKLASWVRLGIVWAFHSLHFPGNANSSSVKFHGKNVVGVHIAVDDKS